MIRINNGDMDRMSVCSSSCSSQGWHDEPESLCNIYTWGEVWSDIMSKFTITDVLTPRLLESDIVLDVRQIVCGFRHAGLVTRQGEIFTWGEESGGRLGHGNARNTSRPRLLNRMTICNTETISCGEHHTCAISAAGDLYSWGDGTYNIGLLGHDNAISHWMPKRVAGPLEGIPILSVACGSWHSALITLSGKVFTFGDGTFGALGHGDRQSFAYPKEVESLSGLRTLRVACGVWHTAAIVEVLGQSVIEKFSRKLFTWGDGDKYRLGHGDKEPRLVPTCISSLIDHNFHQLHCGYNMTVSLTTSGTVMTWGSTVYGQLGNPRSEGKLPCVVEDSLSGEFVEEIACGGYHVMVLTSKSEVFSWGYGANGRLGHGDVEDRNTPTIVEALKDREVKNISCGSNFSACICTHKWGSGLDYSSCYSCKQAFGFTRKRHTCYNCGSVYCHNCSSRKIVKAALAPVPCKPNRVCDTCYANLKAAAMDASLAACNIPSVDTEDNVLRGGTNSSKVLLTHKSLILREEKNEIQSNRISQVPSPMPLKDIAFPSALSTDQISLKPVLTKPLPLAVNTGSKPLPSSPRARKSKLPHLFSANAVTTLKITNERLDKEVSELQTQVKYLKQKCETQEIVMKNYEKEVAEATSRAVEKSKMCSTLAECIKSIETQLTDMVEKVPPEIGNNLKDVTKQAETTLASYTMKHADLTLVSENKEDTSHQSMDYGSSSQGIEVTEKYEPGVHVTLILNRDGTRDFKKVQFRGERSERRRFQFSSCFCFPQEKKSYGRHQI